MNDKKKDHSWIVHKSHVYKPKKLKKVAPDIKKKQKFRLTLLILIKSHINTKEIGC